LIRERNPPCSRRQRPTAPAQTTMSPSFPPEILDIIVNQLRDEPTALKSCCVASKSWIHRTRIHLFASVEFRAPNSHIKLWKKTFPDPSNSPAHHTRSLSICGLSAITAEDADASDWIRTFHNLVHLHLECLAGDRISLAPFCGLSPTLRSLSLRATPLEVLDFICSFPLLEDLVLVLPGYGSEGWNAPSTSPKLTGSLELRAIGEIRPTVRRLLGLPDGLHFTKVTIVCLDEDVRSIMDLVSRCSDTLESLSVCYYHSGVFTSASMSGQHLTTTRECRHVWDTSPRSLQGHKAQGYIASVQWTDCPAVRDGAPNCPVQTPSTDHCSTVWCLCAPGQGNGSSKIAGPRPHIGPILELTPDSSKDHVYDGEGRE
jgi:hypothetical protein